MKQQIDRNNIDRRIRRTRRSGEKNSQTERERQEEKTFLFLLADYIFGVKRSLYYYAENYFQSRQ